MRPTPTQPVTPWGVLRPYLLAVALLLAADGLVYGAARYLSVGLPWALVDLLVIAAVANFWGSRPALLALALAALLGPSLSTQVPDTSLYNLPRPTHVRLARSVLFVLCGGVLIGIAREAQRLRERATLRRDVVQALQRMVLPETLPAVPQCDIAAVYRPARQEEEVGGDFYDVFPVDPAQGLYGVLLGDIMGKGKEAAEHTALLRYAARAYAALPCGPAEILGRLNGFVATQGFTLGSASLFVGLLHAETGTLRYANAGHEPPLLARADGPEETLDVTGPLVGLLPDAPYEERTLELRVGDALLLVTDGVTEARDAQGKFLDDAGAWRLLRPSLAAPSAAGVAQEFYKRLETFTAGRQRDDIAILLLRRLAPRPARRLPALLASVKRPTASRRIS